MVNCNKCQHYRPGSRLGDYYVFCGYKLLLNPKGKNCQNDGSANHADDKKHLKVVMETFINNPGGSSPQLPSNCFGVCVSYKGKVVIHFKVLLVSALCLT